MAAKVVKVYLHSQRPYGNDPQRPFRRVQNQLQRRKWAHVKSGVIRTHYGLIEKPTADTHTRCVFSGLPSECSNTMKVDVPELIDNRKENPADNHPNDTETTSEWSLDSDNGVKVCVPELIDIRKDTETISELSLDSGNGVKVCVSELIDNRKENPADNHPNDTETKLKHNIEMLTDVKELQSSGIIQALDEISSHASKENIDNFNTKLMKLIVHPQNGNNRQNTEKNEPEPKQEKREETGCVYSNSFISDIDQVMNQFEKLSTHDKILVLNDVLQNPI